MGFGSDPWYRNRHGFWDDNLPTWSMHSAGSVCRSCAYTLKVTGVQNLEENFLNNSGLGILHLGSKVM